MKRLLACAVVACGHSSPPAPAAKPAPPAADAAVPDAAPPTPEARASAVTDGLAKHDFAGVEKLFAPAVARALDEAQLGQLWTTLTKQAGDLKSCDAAHVRTEKPGQPTVVIVPCHFAKGSLDFVVALDESLQVAGLHLTPHADERPWSPPAYGATNAVTREVMIGDLPGTLTIPSGTGPFPVVVLVHGSGPNDGDETIGPNKIFADLALGLAAKGIATLRYDKRTNAHPETLPKAFTIDDEVVKDAVAAVDAMATTPVIDRARIYLLGHSLGGYIAPRIAQRAKRLAGIMLMAGATLPLGDKVVEQLTYIANADGTVDADEQRAIDDAKAAAKRIAELQHGAAPKDGEMQIGAPPSYWKDLAGYDAPAVAAALTLPILVLQGARDYQVTKADYAGWQKALAKKKTAKLVLYPALNHLFIAGEGPSTPAEYEKPGHVAEQVIADIASWIAAKP